MNFRVSIFDCIQRFSDSLFSWLLDKFNLRKIPVIVSKQIWNCGIVFGVKIIYYLGCSKLINSFRSDFPPKPMRACDFYFYFLSKYIGWVAGFDQRGTWFESRSLHYKNLSHTIYFFLDDGQEKCVLYLCLSVCMSMCVCLGFDVCVSVRISPRGNLYCILHKCLLHTR